MLLVSIVLFSTLYTSHCVPDFSYNLKTKHPDTDWKGTCSLGSHQSPVNIEIEKTTKEKHPAYLKNYSKLVSGNITNDGHTIKIKFNDTENVFFVTDKKTKYQLHSMHFHWGCSEHRFNNKSYSMELHLVHYNPRIGKYEDVEQYSSQGISVVAVLFEESQYDNEALNVILEMIRANNAKGRKVSYRDLLPKKLEHVYQYPGSLTTPPCWETVLWHVIETKAPISKRQVQEFQTLSPSLPSYNCRWIKPLYNREIIRVKVITDASSSSFKLKSKMCLQISIFFILFPFVTKVIT